VLAVTKELLIEALSAREDSQASWEAFARDWPPHRGVVHDRFGWHRDGNLGRLGQINTWTTSGHEFFAEHRLLRYRREPAAWQALDLTTAVPWNGYGTGCAAHPGHVPGADPRRPLGRQPAQPPWPNHRHRPGRLLCAPSCICVNCSAPGAALGPCFLSWEASPG
jgi:Fructosamine kinase